MNQSAFTEHLDSKSIKYNKLNTTTVLGLSVIKIIPKDSRINYRVFDRKTGDQLDQNIDVTDISMASRIISKKQLIRLIDDRIQNMSTKGVYYPRRLKPKWNSLNNDKDRL